MVAYKPTSRCPRCRRTPAVRFSADEVRRFRTERQTARIQTVQCSNGACRAIYWIMAGEIADATRDAGRVVANGNGLPRDFPLRGRVALQESGITLAELRKIDDWTTIPGIGPSTADAMRAALGEPDLHEVRS